MRQNTKWLKSVILHMTYLYATFGVQVDKTTLPPLKYGVY